MIDISKAFDLWNLAIFLNGTSLQECHIYTVVSQDSILGSDGVICPIAIHDDDATIVHIGVKTLPILGKLPISENCRTP